MTEKSNLLVQYQDLGDDVVVDNIIKLNHEIEELLEKKALTYKQREKQHWLKHGDCKKKFTYEK